MLGSENSATFGTQTSSQSARASLLGADPSLAHGVAELFNAGGICVVACSIQIDIQFITAPPSFALNAGPLELADSIWCKESGSWVSLVCDLHAAT